MDLISKVKLEIWEAESKDDMVKIRSYHLNKVIDNINEAIEQLNAIGEVGYVKVELSSAQILNSNSVPIELIPAPGAGKFILPTNIVANFKWGSIQYATKTILNYVWGHSSTAKYLDGAVLHIDSNANIIYFPLSSSTEFYDRGLTQLEDATFNLYAIGDNPTAGDSTIDVQVWYKIITL